LAESPFIAVTVAVEFSASNQTTTTETPRMSVNHAHGLDPACSTSTSVPQPAARILWPVIRLLACDSRFYLNQSSTRKVAK
jgi:hypothetical protein